MNFLPLLISYAEIHYHLKYLFPKYFKKEPEIIADLPSRLIKSISTKLPILVIIKDSHLFPITLETIQIKIFAKEKNINKILDIQKIIKQKYYSEIMEVDISSLQPEQLLKISIQFEIKLRGKNKKFFNDNYPDINLQYFQTYYAEEDLPKLPNWFAGESHYHSIHTSDQVEFGADIAATTKLAKVMGLNWLFVTDHSYDLDDNSSEYTKYDPKLPIWHKMRDDCKKCDDSQFRTIAGEEVSIGNSHGKNVHMLSINHPEFIEGAGDSAEIWFKNKPDRNLTEIKKLHQPDNLFIAAHPVERISFLQKLTLRRGNWSVQDYKNADISFLQIINNAEVKEIERSVKYWKTLLLQDHRFFMIAGNDAHGNFNVMRQITIPFWKLFTSHKQIFGNFFTMFNYKNNSPIKGLKSGKIIISNGPFINFSLISDGEKYHIGSTVTKHDDVKIELEVATSPEFGEITDITLYSGNIVSQNETKVKNITNHDLIDLPSEGYLRMSLETKKGGLAFTNPIWVEDK